MKGNRWGEGPKAVPAGLHRWSGAAGGCCGFLGAATFAFGFARSAGGFGTGTLGLLRRAGFLFLAEEASGISGGGQGQQSGGAE